MHNFTVKPSKTLKAQFYKDESLKVKKAMKFFLSGYGDVSLMDDSDFSGSLVVDVHFGELDKTGSQDEKTPWLRIDTLPKVIENLKKINYKICDMAVKKKNVSISFCKTTKKSNFI